MQNEIKTGLLADTGQLAVARTMPVPFTAAIAAACDDDVMAAVGPLDALWQRDRTGPFGRSDLAAARTRWRARRSDAAPLRLRSSSPRGRTAPPRSCSDPPGGQHTAGADGGGSGGTESHTPLPTRSATRSSSTNPRRCAVAGSSTSTTRTDDSRDNRSQARGLSQRRPSPPGRTTLGSSAIGAESSDEADT